jgi:hypothetical protein
MAKSRRNNMRKSRRNNMRKSRRNARKSRSRRANRKNATRRGGARGFFGKVYSPVSHLLQATGEAVGTVTGAVDSVAKTGIRGVNRIGKSVTGHADSAVRNLVSRKSRKNRKGGRK